MWVRLNLKQRAQVIKLDAVLLLKLLERLFVDFLFDIDELAIAQLKELNLLFFVLDRLKSVFAAEDVLATLRSVALMATFGSCLLLRLRFFSLLWCQLG